MFDSVSEGFFSNKSLTISQEQIEDEEIMSPVEAIGDRMIKRFANTIDPQPKKINKGKITFPSKNNMSDEEHESSSKQDFFGLRNDYKHLLETRNGFPWHQISLLKTPHVQELLISLHLLEKCEKNTLEFALFLANNPSPSTTIILGELLFLADRISHIRVSIDYLEASITWLHENFEEAQNKVIDKLHKHYLSHKKTNVQSPEIALMTQLSVELAQILLTGKGAVNFAIIPSLLHYFVDEPITPFNHEINIVYTFQRLLCAPSIREKLAQITRPESEVSPSNLVIRAVLDLPSNVIPTDLHAQQTALSGLLSHIRQGVDGSCFATPLVMGLLSSHLERCLDDFSSLLSNGRLTRKIHKAVKEFPFLLRMNNKSLNLEIELKRSGEIFHSGKPLACLWDIPGIIKACEAIGLKDHEIILKKIIPQFFQHEEKHVEIKKITIRHVLQELSKYAAHAKSSSASELGLIFSTIYFAFEGQISNALLGVWENSIAGMAEGDEESLVTSTIINTTINVLNEKMKEMRPLQMVQRKNLKAIIKEILRDRIQLHYDPIIHHASPSKDQHTTEGAFVLYDRGDYSRSTSWTRVDDPQEYSSFISRVLERAKQKIEKEELASYDKLFDGLISYCSSTDFLQNILSQYFSKQAKAPRTLTNYKKLKYTPWITKSGNNFSKVIQVYFEFPPNFHSLAIHALDQRDLFLKLGSFGRSLSLLEKNEYLDNPYRCVAARIPGVHAFSLMLGHPSFLKAWLSDVNLDGWLHEKVIIPGQKVASSPIQKDLRKKVISFTLGNLLELERVEAFKLNIATLPKNLSICEFRNNLVRLAGLSAKQLQLFDSYLVENLPEELKRILNESAIHFGDTNWSDGLNDLHFCFVINPGSGSLEIWAAHDDKIGMQSLDQRLWLQEWEVFSSTDFSCNTNRLNIN